MPNLKDDPRLTFILNFSIETNCVENDWKNARVTPFVI
jgi:hypothetical protein